MTATQDSIAAAIAVNRFGLGAKPGELAVVEKHPSAWLRQQLEGAPPALSGDGLESSAHTLMEVLALRKDVARARQEKKHGNGDAARAAAALKLPAIYRPVYIAEAHARFAHAVGT